MTGEHDHNDHTRRHALECMVWAGTGALWTLAGGVPKALGLIDSAHPEIADQHVEFGRVEIRYSPTANPDWRNETRPEV